MYHIISYHISLIDTASLISTPVRYYFNAINIKIVLFFNSSTPLNNVACHCKSPDRVSGISGMEYWNGMVEWNTGME